MNEKLWKLSHPSYETVYVKAATEGEARAIHTADMQAEAAATLMGETSVTAVTFEDLPRTFTIFEIA